MAFNQSSNKNKLIDEQLAEDFSSLEAKYGVLSQSFNQIKEYNSYLDTDIEVDVLIKRKNKMCLFKKKRANKPV